MIIKWIACKYRSCSSINQLLSERRTDLVAKMKYDVCQREDEELRRISVREWRTALLRLVHGQYTARYVVFHPRDDTWFDEIHRSPSSRRDTSFFILAPRYIVLHFRAEIRRPSSFIFAPRYVVYLRSFSRRDTFLFR